MPNPDPVTLLIAVWGAVVSTILGIMKLVEYRKDRPIIKVFLQPDMKASPAMSMYGPRTLLLVNVVNVGRRPTSITHVSLKVPGGPALLCADAATATYPVELTENKSHSFVFDQGLITFE